VAPDEAAVQRVEQRPVGDRVGPVEHRLGLAIGAGHRPTVEVVATDDDRGTHCARGDEVVEQRARLVALAIAEPADASRQALEGNSLLGPAHPPVQAVVVREELEDRLVGDRDVLRVAGEGGPAERPLPSQNSGRMYAGTKPGKSNARPYPPCRASSRIELP
jgi:hypothetical protein